MSSAIVFLLLAVAVATVGSLVAFVRTRNPASVESGIDDFRREMDALAPRPDEGRREIWDT
jgi:hypothetical protein